MLADERPRFLESRELEHLLFQAVSCHWKEVDDPENASEISCRTRALDNVKQAHYRDFVDQPVVGGIFLY